MQHDHLAEADQPARSRFWILTLGCIGVVYGDIGTSPLYAFREAIQHVAGNDAINQVEILGLLSIIIWALILSVTVKYVLFLLHIDNKGEGGTLSLMAMARKSSTKRNGLIFFLGVLGAGLFFGDASITPAMSVLSAVEGLDLVSPRFEPYILPIVIVILITLFSAQKKGTGSVSKLFGPITLVWFICIGALGLYWSLQMPGIFASVNPYYAVYFLTHHGHIALVVMGSAFLAVTGAEALYVDLGHFGRKPIQVAWLYLVFPALVLNYLGQGALVMLNPAALDNPFYMMAPNGLLVPLILLAMAATIIASQAVITGAFSVTRQAIQLGMLPRLEIRHTSLQEAGQIFIPKINRILLCTVLLLCIIFRNSSNLASAYGISVNGTMFITSTLAIIVIHRVFKKPLPLAILIVAPFLLLEALFMWAIWLKFFDGGYISVVLAAIVVLLMTIWVRGTRYLYRQAYRSTVSLSDLIETLDRNPPVRIEGTAIFLTSDPRSAPVALVQNLRHNKILHTHNFILTVLTAPAPKVEDYKRCIIEPVTSNITRIILTFGYMETPDVPRALRIARKQGLVVDLAEATYFLGRRNIVRSASHRVSEDLADRWRHGKRRKRALKRLRWSGLFRSVGHRALPEWQDHIYIAMSHSAAAATDFFRIPRDQVVEMGTQIAV